MNLSFLTSNLLTLAGGSIDGGRRPTVDEYLGVTFAGLGIVIAALAILVLVIFCFGKIFDALDGAAQRKKAKAAADQAPKISQKPAPVKAAPEPAPAPVSAPAAEDDDEVIAVISAVVAMMSEADGTTYRVKSVKPVQSSGFGGRSAWAMDGRRSNVSPF
ncbi:MAG: OadG family protein [Oscillospiraceae bacterium]|nr:OadG family protein [Oscillospiraceae bacterium]